MKPERGKKEETQSRISEIVFKIAQELGKPQVRPGGWHLRTDINLREADPEHYTGPGDHVWILALMDEREQVGSIGFTYRELRFYEVAHREAIETRIREALGKV